MEIKIFFEIIEPENIKYEVNPQPSFCSVNTCVFEISPNQPIDIRFSVVERIGHSSNIIIKKILYEDYEMSNLDNFCTLYKDNKSHKTHGYIDGGTYRIRIRSNPISQHFIEYLMGLTSNF